MCYLFATRTKPLLRCHTVSLVTVLILLSVAGRASADTLYRWSDQAGRLYFSNRADQVPRRARAMKLPELGTVMWSEGDDGQSPAAQTQPVSGDGAVPSAVAATRCPLANASRLISAVTSRLRSMQSGVSANSGLSLFVAATPVWYTSDQNMVLVPGEIAGEKAASQQAAIAYPEGSGCPPVPLERYAAVSGEPSASAGLCDDYRRASAEIDIATERNESVARTFEYAAQRFGSVRTDADSSEVIPSGSDLVTGVRLPAWVVGSTAASSAELATEINEFSEELVVARQEIDRAARAQGCW